MGSLIVHGETCCIDGFDGAHAVAFDAGDLDEAADGVAGHTEVVFHGDLGGVLDGGGVSVERGDEAAGCHATGYADFALAANFGAGDAGIFFVENADGGGGEEVAEQAVLLVCFAHVVRGVVEIEVGDGGDDARGSVGGCGDNAASGGVLFVDGHGYEGDGVHGSERIAEAAFGVYAFQAASEASGAAADVEAAG